MKNDKQYLKLLDENVPPLASKATILLSTEDLRKIDELSNFIYISSVRFVGNINFKKPEKQTCVQSQVTTVNRKKRKTLKMQESKKWQTMGPT
jgi:hypothetical protein